MKKANKGADMEEALRRYFLNLGYYVLRGVKFKYRGFDVTDIDLWLYAKTSALARQRTSVDIKNKKTPQAIERIFWAKGLKETLGLDDCMVATTDSRPDVREFGLLHKVAVLDGPFLSRLQASSKTHLDRISEDEFVSLIDEASLGKLGGNWRGRYEEAKSRVLTCLSFDTCNSYINDIQYFIEQRISLSHSETVSLRLIYALSSMLLITIDFILKDHSAIDNEHRFKLLTDGFRYGDSGGEYARRLTSLAGQLTEVAGVTPGVGRIIVDELSRQAHQIPAEVLAEYLSKAPVQNLLFFTATELEDAAFSPTVAAPSTLTPNAQGVLGALADFLGIDRKKVMK